jgi:hypothetical protein
MKILSVMSSLPVPVRKKISNIWRGQQVTCRVKGKTVSSGEWITLNRSVDSPDVIKRVFPHSAELIPDTAGFVSVLHFRDLAAVVQLEDVLLDAMFGIDETHFSPEEIVTALNGICQTLGKPRLGVFVGQSVWMSSSRMRRDEEMPVVRPEASAMPVRYYDGMSFEDATKLERLLRDAGHKPTFRDTTVITGEFFGIEQEFDRVD